MVIGADELPLEVSISRHAILKQDILVVPDLSRNERINGDPLVQIEDCLRFYAGTLPTDAGGLPRGTVPRT